MSQTQPVPAGEAASHGATPPNPWKNPSYPQRVHIGERAHWNSVLKSCEDRIAAARAQLDARPPGPGREALERLHAQMLGARDQVADGARRLPMETGDLYEEDHHRLEEALAALDRVFQRWDASIG